MEFSDLLKLAGVEKPVEPPKDSSCDVKYCLMAAIEHYNNECSKCHAVNMSNVYNEIITQIDDIIGCVVRKCDEQAKQKFDALDEKVKQDILSLDESGCCHQYFGCNKKFIIKISSDVQEAVETLDKLETTYEPEEVEEIKLPANVISDIKVAIKEYEADDNYHYISHIVDDKYCRVKDALEVLLKYLTNPSEESVKLASVFINSLDSDTKFKVPGSVWKYLSKPSGDSIGTRMKKIEIQKVQNGTN